MANSSSRTDATDPFTEGWIEEGLYYRGLTPPQSPSGDWDDHDWVYLPHESYIPVSKSRVTRAVLSYLGEGGGDEPQRLTHLVKLLEGVYHFHYHEILNELKDDYEYFSPYKGDELRAECSAEELERRERRFMVNFLKLMSRGNFNPLTDHEHRLADQHSYLLDLPIEVNWKIQDQRLIQGLLSYSASEEGREVMRDSVGTDDLKSYLSIPKAFDERCLVFHRGVSPDRTEGLYLPQKLNVIIDRVIELIFKPVQKSVDKVSHQTEHLIEGAVNTGKGAVGSAVNIVTRGRLGGEQPAQGLEHVEEMGSIDSTTPKTEGVVFLPRWLRRTSLQNQRLSLKGFFKPSLMQEPAMERMICLFRLHPPTPPAILKRIPIVKRFVKDPKEGEVDPTIYVKLFQHVPMADLELIFPEKKIKMKSFDKFMLYFLGFVGLVLGLIKGFSDTGGKSALMVILTVLALLAIKSVTRFINTRRRYMLQMSQDLYNKNLDNDVGVLQYLVDSIEDQEYKEALLAYTLLLKAGAPLTEEELDDRVERFLNDHFKGLEVDFEVDDALDKITVELNEMGEEQLSAEQRESTMFLPIVTAQRSADGLVRYQAKPLE
jgi:hypothetical protein